MAATVINPILTNAGLAAAVAAAGNGLQLAITHVALGTGQYTPANPNGQTAMVARKEKVAIAGGYASGAGFMINVLFPAWAGTPNPYNATELGFYAGDPDAGGVLFAIYSAPTGTLVQRNALEYTAQFAMALTRVPAGSVTVTIDPSAAQALGLLAQHEGKSNPHTQYVLKAGDTMTGPLHVKGGASGDLKVSTTGTASGSFASLKLETGATLFQVGMEGTGRFFVYNAAATLDQLIFSGGVNSTASLYATGTGKVQLGTGGNSIRFVIEPTNGYAGLGTASPANLLHMASGVAGIVAQLKLQNTLTSATAGRGSAISFSGTGDATFAQISAFTTDASNSKGGMTVGVNDGTSLVEVLRVIPAGVGVKVSDPDAPTTIQANDSGYAISLRGRTSDNAALIAFKTKNNATERARIEAQGDGKLVATVAGAKCLTMETTGKAAFAKALFAHGDKDVACRFKAGATLPTEDIGPIWHDDYGGWMTWREFSGNGASYTGYASVDIGRIVPETTSNPRSGYKRLALAGANSKVTYAAWWNWALHEGLVVPLSSWAAGTLYYADNGDGTFRAPDIRAEFLRFDDDDRGINTSAVFAAWLAQQTPDHYHGVDLNQRNSSSDSGSGGIATGNQAAEGYISPINTWGPVLSSGVPGTVGIENRPRATHFRAVVHF